MSHVGRQFDNAKRAEGVDIGAITLANDLNAAFGAAEVLLTRPAARKILHLKAEVGSFRVRPGDYRERTFIDGDVTVGTDVIVVDNFSATHEFESGDGPYLLSLGQAVLAGGPGIVIDDVTDTLTRDAGSWLDEGFVVGQTVTLGGSASNNGDLTVTVLTDLVMTVAEELTAEGSQTDLTMTAAGEALPTGLDATTNYFIEVVADDEIAFHTSQATAEAGTVASRVNITAATAGGVHSIAGMPTAPVAAVTNGQSALLVAAPTVVTTNNQEDVWRLWSPDRLTIQGQGGADILMYWWV